VSEERIARALEKIVGQLETMKSIMAQAKGLTLPNYNQPSPPLTTDPKVVDVELPSEPKPPYIILRGITTSSLNADTKFVGVLALDGRFVEVHGTYQGVIE